MLEFHKRMYCGDRGRSIPEKPGVIREIIRQAIADCVDLD